jgi:hypothetical protein
MKFTPELFVKSSRRQLNKTFYSCALTEDVNTVDVIEMQR